MSGSPYPDDVFVHLYDIDLLECNRKEQTRRGQTYTLDRDGNHSRPHYRPRITQDNAVKLPSVLVGQCRVPAASGTDLSAMTRDRRVRMTTTTLRDSNKDVVWHRDGSRQPHREYSASPLTNTSYHIPSVHAKQSETASAHPGYRFPRHFEEINGCQRHPSQEPALPYPQLGNNHRHNFRQVTDGAFTTSGNSYCAPPHRNEFERRYEGMLPIDQRKQNSISYHDPSHQHGPHIPVTPSERPSCGQGYHTAKHILIQPPAGAGNEHAFIPHVPVPPARRPTDNKSFSKTRRGVRNMTQEFQQAECVPQPAAAYIPKPHTPMSPVSDFIDEFDRRVNEAMEMEQKIVDLREEVNNLKKECNELSDDEVKDESINDDEEEDIDKFINELDEILKTPPLLKRKRS